MSVGRILYGAGETGKYVHDRLGAENVACFADTYKQGTTFCGKPVLSPTAAHLAHPDAIWVVCSMNLALCNEMLAAMKELGVTAAPILDVIGTSPAVYRRTSAINITRALDTHGFMQQDELEYLARAASKSRLIAEIGSWMGRSSCAIAANTPGVLFCIDKWLWGNEDILPQFTRNTDGLPIVPIKMDSSAAVVDLLRLGIKFDMIFIDGDHTSPKVNADLILWQPLLAEGGIFCGHDYGDPLWPDVKEAVDAIVGPVRTINRIWTTEGA